MENNKESEEEEQLSLKDFGFPIYLFKEETEEEEQCHL